MHPKWDSSSLYWLPTGFQAQAKVLILILQLTGGLRTCPAGDLGIKREKEAVEKYLCPGSAFASDLSDSCCNVASSDSFNFVYRVHDHNDDVVWIMNLTLIRELMTLTEKSMDLLLHDTIQVFEMYSLATLSPCLFKAKLSHF